MRKTLFAFMLLIAVSANAEVIDMRQYLIPSATSTIRLADPANRVNTEYVFTRNSTGYQGLYDRYQVLMNPGYYPNYDAYGNLTNASQKKPGEIVSWGKTYIDVVTGARCSPTTGILFRSANDQGVIEVGDWLSRPVPPSTSACVNNSVLGYKTGTNMVENTGLFWGELAPMTVGSVGSYHWVYVASQPSPGATYQLGMLAYSRTSVIERLGSYTVNGVTYNDVVHAVMYHGVNDGGHDTCTSKIDSTKANGVVYEHFAGWSNYAIEIYAANGVGIIKENLPYTEGGPYWDSYNTCKGGMIYSNGTNNQYPAYWEKHKVN